MKICLLTQHPTLYSSKRLGQEALNFGVEFKTLSLSQARLSLPMNGESFDLSLNRFSSVDVGDGYLHSLMQLERWGRQVNPWKMRASWWDKTSQGLWLAQNGLPYIPFFSHRGQLDSEDVEWLSFKRDHKTDVGWVLKVNRGQKGIGVHFFDNEADLFAWLETLWRLGDQDFLIQPRLDVKSEFRLTVMNRKPWAVLKREGEKGNFHQGSKAFEVQATPILRPVIEQMCAVEIDYASFDILETPQGLFMSDLNLTPGFEQLEAVTGRNFASNLLESLLKT